MRDDEVGSDVLLVSHNTLDVAIKHTLTYRHPVLDTGSMWVCVCLIGIATPSQIAGQAHNDDLVIIHNPYQGSRPHTY